jgi:hypothetical protein
VPSQTPTARFRAGARKKRRHATLVVASIITDTVLTQSARFMEWLGFGRFVFLAGSLPDLPRGVGVQGGDAKSDDQIWPCRRP